MSIADAPARKGANIAIGKIGQIVTYVRTGEPTANLETGVVTKTDVEYPLKGVETRVHYSMIDGTKIKVSDRLVLIDAVAFEAAMGAGAVPSTDDRIKVGGKDLSIIDYFPVSSGEQYALFKIVVRR